MPVIGLGQGGGGVETEGSEVQGSLGLCFKKRKKAETDDPPFSYGRELSLYMYSFYLIKEVPWLLVSWAKTPEAFLPPQATASAVPHG